MGQRIARLRRERGWTQETLAERSGVARPTIARLEIARGRSRQPSLPTLVRLARAFDITLDELVRGKRA
jgi:transcriptional regulator with XRE-family HTH domain